MKACVIQFGLNLARTTRSAFTRKKSRKRITGLLVFTLFTSYFFLNAVPVEATTCATTGLDITIGSDCQWDAGTYTFTGTLTISNGVTATAGNASSPGLVVLVVEDIDIQGVLTADNLGNTIGNGTGQGEDDATSSSGGGYGGNGGDGDTTTTGGVTYGDVTTPDDLGSGGGNDGGAASGGGAFKLDASGTVTITGTVSADGQTATSGDSGGGSGGSVWIQAGTIAGSGGTVTADGGAGLSDGGGGGGGRIAIEYSVDDSSSWTEQASGGARAATNASSTGDGGAGSIWIYDNSGNGDLIVGNNDRVYGNYTDQVTTSSQTYDNITIKDGAEYRVPSSFDLTLGSSGSLTGGGTEQSRMTVVSGGQFDIGVAAFSLTALDIYNSGTIATATSLSLESDATFTFDTDTGTFTAGLSTVTVKSGTTFSQAGTTTLNLTTIDIQSGATLTHEDNSTSPAANVIDISATTITVNGTLDADSKGFDVGTGPGAGVDAADAGGAGHGGDGGDGDDVADTAGTAYDSIKEPDEPGSGGGIDNTGAGTGGGAAKLFASGTFTLGGIITADGGSATANDSGGGSGGAVWIDAGTLAGTGTITTDGGNGNNDGGAGSGGRVSIVYDTGTTANYGLQAFGGDADTEHSGPYEDGAAGTIYTRLVGENGELTVDNNEKDDANYSKPFVLSTLTLKKIYLKRGALFRFPNLFSFTLESGGSVTSTGTEKPTLALDDGAIFNATTISMSDFKFEHAGTFNATTLTLTDMEVYEEDTAQTNGVNNLIIGSGTTYTLYGTGTHTYDTVTIQSGGTLTHGDNSSAKTNVINISATEIDVQSNGTINVSERGYDGGQGPGVGDNNLGGGGYGGKGGNRLGAGDYGGPTYGSVTQPDDLGSGGGYASSVCSMGGGAVKLIATGTITLDGSITTEGDDSHCIGSPGGAGGSVWLDAGTLAGSGSISVEGGDYGNNGGGGGGGRIALYYTGGDPNAYTYSMKGGDGADNSSPNEDGGAGTLYIKQASATYGDLTVDGGDRPYTNYTDQVTTASQTYDNITIKNGAKYRARSGYTLTLDTGGSLSGSGAINSELIVESGGTFTPTGATTFTFDDVDFIHEGALSVVTDLIHTNNTYTVDTSSATFSAGTPDIDVGTSATMSIASTSTLTVGTLNILSTGTLTHEDNSTSKVNVIDISASLIDVQSGGTVNVNELGFDGGQGPGVGDNNRGGGGYGGKGGNRLGTGDYGGPTYGSVTQPDDFGSGGGTVSSTCSMGGGAVKLFATGTITLDGSITAEGDDSACIGSGGGAGGSVWIQAGSVAGSGSISVEGGNYGNNGGGGGGGRIAIYYTGGNPNAYTHSMKGGDGADNSSANEDGGAGTLYIKQASATYGDLTVDGGDRPYTNYTDQVTTASQTYDNITIKGGAKYRVRSGYTLTLDTGGGLTGGGTLNGELALASGGTLNTTGATSFTFNDVDVTHEGAINIITDLTVVDSIYTVNAATATFGAGTPDIDVGASGTMSASGTSTLTVGTLNVLNTGTLTHEDNSSSKVNVVDISATTIDIQSGGVVDVDDKGYDGAQGPGLGIGPGGGGGHGGVGGDRIGAADYGGPVNGSVTQPDSLGTGGGSSVSGLSQGGGAVKLFATGTMTLDGTITADGNVGVSYTISGGGAGGSVWLQAATLAGSGAVSTEGGNKGNNGGGGGGGRIAVYYTSGNPSSYTFTVNGGDGNDSASTTDGGAGTIYLKQASATNGDLTIDAGGYTSANYTDIGTSTSLTFDNITVSDGAKYRIQTGASLTLASGGSFTGGGTPEPSITVDSGGTLDLSESSTIDDCAITNNGTATLATTFTNQNANWINTGTIAGVSDFTCTSGSCTNSGNFSGGLTTLTVGNSGNFRQQSTAALFSGSDLIVENGGTFTQENTTTIDVGTVWIKTGGTLTHSDNSTSKAAVIDITAVTVNIESGATVTGDALGFDESLGTGQGDDDATSAGGGGYGGAGGNGSGAATGGSTYGTQTAPDDLGSGGGTDTSSGTDYGGSGGGAIKIIATGTFTVNGTITMDGQNSPSSDGGGGSGGSIWLEADTFNGTCEGVGANGGTSVDGGGGGGGRVRIAYFTDSMTCTPTATGGVSTNTNNGSDGVVTEVLNAPTIDSFYASPSDPTTDDPVTIYSQASYSGDVKKIELWLDGTIGVDDPIRVCNFSPAGSPENCNHNLGTLSAGNHTMAVRATGDDDSTATDTGSFDVAGETTDNQISLSRLAVSETNVDFALTFTLTGTDTGTLTVTFPGDFTVTSAGDDPGSDDCLTNFSYTATTLVATKTSCSGAITLGGATVTNPATPGAYTISWTNDNGSGEVYIVDDDQVSVSSDVDPTLSFNVGTSTSCDGTYSGNGGTLALGSLTTASVTTSDVSGVNHVCTRVTTNATNGAAVTVRAFYGALTSTSVPADTINSSTATLSAGSEGFGICVGSDGGHTGLDATTPTGASPTAQSPFSSTCNTTTHNVGALTTSTQSLWTLSGASQNAFARIFIKAAIASDTPAHADYTETVTFIATATY